MLIAFAVLFSSCSGDVSVPTTEIVTDPFEEMKAESKNSMSSLGVVKSVVDLNPDSAKGVDGQEAITISEDKKGLKSTYHIVYYDSISETILAHLNTIPKEDFHIPGIKNKIDKSANYVVVFRSCYYTGRDKATPAYREVYLLDVDSIDKHNNVLMQEITFSPDFAYDIDNQLEISTGKPVKYDWESGSKKDADYYKETTDSFDSLDSLINEKWILVNSAGEPVTREHVAASYVLKINKQNALDFFPFNEYEAGSFSSTNLRIRNHVFSGNDIQNYAFLIVEKYPEGYRHVWEIICYWHDNGNWHYSINFQTDNDFLPIRYVDVTETKLASFFNEAKAIGTITRIYQAYKGNELYLENSNRESYVVEYSNAHSNLRSAIENTKGKKLSGGYSRAGRLQDSTVAYAYIMQNVNTNALTACILIVDDYTSYTYLTIKMFDDELAINDKFLSSLSSIYYDNATEKYRDISNYDGSLYYSEYEYANNLVATLQQLGTITDVCYYTGKTGQTKPHINTFTDSPNYYVSIAAQFSSFDQNLLASNYTETRPQNTYFTVGSSSYNFDYQKEGIVTVELDVFFTQNGNLNSVQIRVVTDPSAITTNNYATTYVMEDSFFVTSVSQ